MLKLFLVTTAVLTAQSAFASWHYQPKGQRISIEQAASAIATGQQYTEFTFAENQMFVEFGDEQKPETLSYAVTTNVASFEDAMDAKIPGKIIQSGRYRYKLGWNKLARLDGNRVEMVYSAFNDFRDTIKSPGKEGGFKDEQDSRGYITYTWAQNYTLLTLAGPDVTYYAMNSGDGGGAHPYAWSGMIHKNFGYGQDSLLDVVDNQGLLDALKANPVIRKDAQDQNMTAQLDAVTQITDFDRLAPDLTSFANGTKWSSLEGDQWKKFAVYDYDPATQIADMRVGLEYSSEASRGSFSQIEVTVKVTNTDYAQALADVKTGKTQGQLMIQVPAAQQPPMNGLDDQN